MRRTRRSQFLWLLPWLLLPLAAVPLTALELRLKNRLSLKPKPGESAGPRVVWRFETSEPGAIVSSPVVTDGRVYVGAIREAGLSPRGVVYALDEATGTPVWRSDAGGKMIHMYSSPSLAGGRLYIGEGMHANFDCKLWCLDAATGQKQWEFAATSHIESTPCVADGRMFFGAGDDGVYALDAASGQRLWQFDEERHVDSSPAVADGKVFVGSGVSARYKTCEILALDAQTGRPVWRVPTALPVWGSPVVDGGQLFIGVGNGRLDRSDEHPAGAVLCLDAATGKRQWERPVPDGVLARVAVDSERVYFGCRDERVYAVSRTDGRVLWKSPLGSAVVTAPALLDGRLYVAASAGRVVCLDVTDGTEVDSFDLGACIGTECRVYSSPAVRPGDNGRHLVYIGAEIRFPVASLGTLLCLSFDPAVRSVVGSQ